MCVGLMTPSSSGEMAKYEKRKESTGKQEKMKHVSDDVTSLDSWSDVCSTPGTGRSSPAESFCFVSENDNRHSNANRYSGSTDTLILNPVKLLTKTSYEPAKQSSKLLQTSHHTHYGLGAWRKDTPSSYKPATLIVPSSETSQPLEVKIPKDRNPQHRTSSHTSRRGSSSKLQVDNLQQTNHGHIIDRKIFSSGRTNVPSFPTEMAPQQKSELPNNMNESKDNFSSLSSFSDLGSDPLLEQGEKVKTKLLSVWNNVRYGRCCDLTGNINNNSEWRRWVWPCDNIIETIERF